MLFGYFFDTAARPASLQLTKSGSLSATLALDNVAKFADVGLKFINADNRYDKVLKSQPLEAANASSLNMPNSEA